MYLKSLILKGFKSFADRSVLEFEPGIAAVVGPNGSGKSNISDAILWVLGERNAKNLRGQAMEDVIFSGSSARKPVGIAEVELVLDNSDHTLPIDFGEVSIARRMYRSGESEYLINGAIVRRLDVLDILHDSGLGTGTHSIISQGNLDTILQSKPENRRALIEEAAGILKHKQRKMKSERKLEHMDNHLTRIQDITREVERQLKPLERKAKRAQAYQGLAEELAELNLALAVDGLRVLKEKWQKVISDEVALSDQLKEMNEKIRLIEDEMQKLQEEVQQHTLNANDIVKESRRAQAIQERLDSTGLLLLEKERSAINYDAEIRQALDENAIKYASLIQGRLNSHTQLNEIKAERETTQSRLDELALEHTEVSQSTSLLEVSHEQLLREESELRQELEALNVAKAQNLERLSSSKAHEKLIVGHRIELESQIERALYDLDLSRSNRNDLEVTLTELQIREKKARISVSEFFIRREETSKNFEKFREESSLIAAEIKGIEEIERLSQKSSPALSWLLDNKEHFDDRITFLSHEIQAPQDLDVLIESLLGIDLQALIVHDMTRAKMITEALGSREEQGEVILIPGGNAFVVPEKDLLKTSGGEPLLSLIKFDEMYRRPIEAVLGDVIICANIGEALSAHEKDSLGLRFATREGFVIGRNSRISIGMNRTEDEGVLVRHRRFEELRSEYVRYQKEIAECKLRKDQEDKELASAQSVSLQVTQESAQQKGALLASQEEVKRAEEKLEALKRESVDLERQEDEAKAILERAQPESVHIENRIVELVRALEQTKEQIQANNAEKKPLHERNKKLLEQLSSARLRVATLSERENYARRMLESGEAQIKALMRERHDSFEILVRKGIVKERVKPLLAQLEKLSAAVKIRIGDLEEGANQAQNSTSGLSASMNDARLRTRQTHDEAKKISDMLSESKVEKGRLELQVEAAVNNIVHDCKTPLETALDLPVLENKQETEESVFKLRRRIANMGTINPDAAFEYDELKTRYDYLVTQLEDMRYARRALARIIRIIDARMEDAFIGTFEQVNMNFKKIFAILFPGGSAELLLSDIDDLENTGVEVTAQPRGKRITKMMLMSGGEKSLTALALLFAVYRIRSAPFYILDEVEAALDDSNLRRLCSYFVSQRNDTQLILITHQRRTMEIADVLYGVSMQADGVTQVVGQKLDQAMKHSEG